LYCRDWHDDDGRAVTECLLEPASAVATTVDVAHTSSAPSTIRFFIRTSRVC
jgi:hypothetical protein